MLCPLCPRRVVRPGRSDTDVPVLGFLVVVLLLLLVGGGGFMMWQWRKATQMELMAREMELVAREEAERARDQAEEARAAAEEAARKNEKALAKVRRQGTDFALDQGLKLCGQGQVNDGLLWFARGLEESGDDADLQRTFRASLAAWGQPQPEARKLFGQAQPVTALALSPDGKTVLTGGADGVARAWPAEGGKAVGEAPPAEEKVSIVGFGAGGKEWLVANGRHVRRVDAATGKPIGELTETPPRPVLALTATADGKLMMFGTCEEGVWLAGAGSPQKPFTPESPVLSGAFGPGGKTTLTGHEDRTARLWGADGKELGEPLRHDGPVAAVAVSADGQLFATAAGKAARLWDAATHRPIGRPLVHATDVLSLAFRPDGKGLLTGDRAGGVWEWAVPAPIPGEVRRLKLWAEVTAGKEVDATGAVRPLDAATRAERRGKLAELGGPPTP